MSAVQIDLLALPISPRVEVESQSGLQLGNPQVYRALAHYYGNRTAAIVMHVA